MLIMLILFASPMLLHVDVAMFTRLVCNWQLQCYLQNVLNC